MMKTIVMLSAAALMTAALATPSLARSRHNSAREAYAQDFGYNSGCKSHCGPARAAAFWQPGMCWVDQDRLRRLGYFAPCKK